MKLKFRSSLSNLNKFNPFDNPSSDMKPIDLSLKSRIKNFMKKSNKNEFKTSSNSLDSISSYSSNSINSISPTHSLNHQYDHQYDQPCAPSTTAINICGNLLSVPPSPPNSIEDEEEYVHQQQRQQIYYNQQIQKQPVNCPLITDLLNTSHLNQTNEIMNKRKQEIYSRLVELSSKNQFQLNEQLDLTTSKISSSLTQSTAENSTTNQHVHYQKQMVRKHTLQMNRQRTHYNPYSQATKRKCVKHISDEEEDDDSIQQELEDINYYDSTKLINELKMKYCPKRKQSNHTNLNASSPVQNQPFKNSNNSVVDNRANHCHVSQNNFILKQSNCPNVNPINNQPTNNDLCGVNAVQTLYREYYNYLLSQPDARLSALQIIMKRFLEQNNNFQFKESNNLFHNFKGSNSPSIEAQSLSSLSSSTPSPNNQQQMNFNLLYNNNNYINLPSTPSSLKDGQTNEMNSSSPINIQQEERKRSTRPLTGRHVRQGTGASPTTLANLKLAIKERQKCSTTNKPMKRKGK